MMELHQFPRDLLTLAFRGCWRWRLMTTDAIIDFALEGNGYWHGCFAPVYTFPHCGLNLKTSFKLINVQRSTNSLRFQTTSPPRTGSPCDHVEHAPEQPARTRPTPTKCDGTLNLLSLRSTRNNSIFESRPVHGTGSKVGTYCTSVRYNFDSKLKARLENNRPVLYNR